MSRIYFTIRLHGNGNISAMLTKLKSVDAKITSLSISDGAAHFRTDQKGVSQIRRYRRSYGLKATITRSSNSNSGAIFTTNLFFIGLLVPLVGSFFLWTVDVESDVPEVAERIEEKLSIASIVPLRPLVLIPDEGEIRRTLMKDDPSLSWIRFKRVGTTLTVIPMLSPTLDVLEEPKGLPSHLIASTSGVITNFELKQGERVGHVHQTVKKGDLLATGVLEQGDKQTIIGAEGAVYADYWLEYSFSLPRTIHYKVQGEEQMEFTFSTPWNEKNDNNEETEDLKAFLSRLITIKRHVLEVDEKLELSEENEQTVLVPLLKQKILSERASSMIIKDEKVLHVTYVDDKVSGTILFHVNDNIAIKRPIPQGD